MKKIALVLIAIALVSVTAIAGDMAKVGQWGVQASIGAATSPVQGVSTIGAKFMASENVAIRVEAGLSSYSPPSPGTVYPSTTPAYPSGSTTGYEFGAGFEYHMTAVGGVSPYVGLQAGYASGSTPAPAAPATAPPTPATFSVTGVWGGEYFFSSNFSWGGEIGLGFSSTTNIWNGGVDASGKLTYGSSSTIGTGSATMILTWYLN